MPNYSQEFEVNDLSRERIETALEIYDVDSIQDAKDRMSQDPIIEVGREDDSRGKGRKAVIDPCPLCGSRHEHKFGVDLQEGKIIEKPSNCTETTLYWLFWNGEGTGDWRKDDS